jgi:hypothetical protein
VPLRAGADWKMLKAQNEPLVFQLTPPLGRDAVKVIAADVRSGYVDFTALLDTGLVERGPTAASSSLGKLFQRVALGGNTPLPTVPRDDWATFTFWVEIKSSTNR